MSDANRWDERYTSSGDRSEPLAVLVENRHLLPSSGDALDLACGSGSNSLLLASSGLTTWSWDFSAVAIEQLAQAAAAANLGIHAEVRNVVEAPPEANRFDVIVVGRFLERSIVGDISTALRPGGLLFYQTFIRNAVDASGPSNPDYRLGENELRNLFGDLSLLVYREEGLVGDLKRGFRNEAMMVARRPDK